MYKRNNLGLEDIDLWSIIDKSSLISITDPRGIIVYVNSKFCDLSQYSKDELIGRNHKVVNSGYHNKQFWKSFWSTLARKEVWRGEMKNQKKDGEFYWVDTTIYPYQQDEKSPLYYVSIRRDITDVRKASQIIEEQNKYLNSVADFAPGLLMKYQMDSQGKDKILFISKGVHNIYGTTEKEALKDSDNVWKNIHPEDRQGLLEAINKSKDHLSTFEYSYRVTPNSTKTLNVTSRATPYLQEDGSIIWYALILDNTESQSLLQKLKDYAQFTSHELRGPISRILGLIDLGAGIDSEDQTLNDYLKSSISELERVTRAMNDMLAGTEY